MASEEMLFENVDGQQRLMDNGEVIKKYVQKCYKILNFYSIGTKCDTYKM